MPTLSVEYQERDYSSVKAYLLDLTIDVEKLVDNRAKKRRFREQLRTYKKIWEVWTTTDEEIRKGCWKPPMERPEFLHKHPLKVFTDSYNPQNAPKKEVRRLAGCYSLLAFIHDSELFHLNRINNDIIVSSEIIKQTLAAPRNIIGGGYIDRKNKEIAEMYLIEECYNRVRVDIKKHCERVTGTLKAEDLAETKKIKNAKTLSDVDLFDKTARRFEDRSIKPLRKDETWYDLDRSLKPWFDLAIQRLHQEGKTKGIGLLQYEYQNLLHYVRNINIKVLQGNLFDLARKEAAELAKKFRDIAREIEKDSLAEGAATTKAHAVKPAEIKHKAAPAKERKKKGWKPPRGYIGSKEIQHDHNVPRSTLEGWQNQDSVPGGDLEGRVKKDPRTQEVYYPKKWFEKRFKNYKPRARKHNSPNS